MNAHDFIKPELLMLIPVLYFLGKWMCKTCVHDYFWLGVVGIVLSGMYIAATCDCRGFDAWLLALYASITQGILVTGCSVYIREKK